MRYCIFENCYFDLVSFEILVSNDSKVNIGLLIIL